MREFPTAEIEASSIALVIKRIMASTGGMLGFSDFVILRMSASENVYAKWVKCLTSV